MIKAATRLRAARELNLEAIADVLRSSGFTSVSVSSKLKCNFKNVIITLDRNEAIHVSMGSATKAFDIVCGQKVSNSSHVYPEGTNVIIANNMVHEVVEGLKNKQQAILLLSKAIKQTTKD